MHSETPWNVKIEAWRLIAGLRPGEDKLFLVLAVFTGALAGTIAVLYHLFIDFLFHLSFHESPTDTNSISKLLLPALGALIGGIILLRVREARGSGINKLKTSLLAHDGYVSLRGTAAKFLASGIGIGLGLPLGPEDPALHIGGGVASGLGRLFSLSKKRMQQLVPVGATAGLAAAFNTPITAVIFTLEEIVGDINAPLVGSTVLAAVVAVVIERAVLGSHPLFRVPPYRFGQLSDLLWYAMLGVVGGIASAMFTRLLTGLRARLGRIPRRGVVDPVTVAGGLVAGLLAIAAPQILGAGYDWVDDALNGRLVLRLMALLLACKLLGTAVSFATGNSGGLFAPSLYLGAMLGGTVGALAKMYFPQMTSDVGAYALVGMGAMFAGIIRAPITSIFMIFEVTQDYEIMLPVMVCNVVAYSVARALHHDPLFEVLAHQDGIHLPRKEDRQLEAVTAASAMRAPTVVLDAGQSVSDALERVRGSAEQAFVVSDGSEFTGVVTTGLLTRTTADGGGARPVREIAVQAAGYRIFPDQSLSAVLARLGAGAVLLPVVSRENPSRLLGVVTTEDVLRAYGIASQRAESTEVRPESREASLDEPSGS